MVEDGWTVGGRQDAAGRRDGGQSSVGRPSPHTVTCATRLNHGSLRSRRDNLAITLSSCTGRNAPSSPLCLNLNSALILNPPPFSNALLMNPRTEINRYVGDVLMHIHSRRSVLIQGDFVQTPTLGKLDIFRDYLLREMTELPILSETHVESLSRYR